MTKDERRKIWLLWSLVVRPSSDEERDELPTRALLPAAQSKWLPGTAGRAGLDYFAGRGRLPLLAAAASQRVCWPPDRPAGRRGERRPGQQCGTAPAADRAGRCARSEEHTSELQSLTNLVCRLLLEKKKDTHRHAYRATRPDAMH